MAKSRERGKALRNRPRRPRTVRTTVECLEDRYGATGVSGMAGLECTALIGVGCAALAAGLAAVHDRQVEVEITTTAVEAPPRQTVLPAAPLACAAGSRQVTVDLQAGAGNTAAASHITASSADVPVPSEALAEVLANRDGLEPHLPALPREPIAPPSGNEQRAGSGSFSPPSVPRGAETQSSTDGTVAAPILVNSTPQAPQHDTGPTPSENQATSVRASSAAPVRQAPREATPSAATLDALFASADPLLADDQATMTDDGVIEDGSTATTDDGSAMDDSSVVDAPVDSDVSPVEPVISDADALAIDDSIFAVQGERGPHHTAGLEVQAARLENLSPTATAPTAQQAPLVTPGIVSGSSFVSLESDFGNPTSAFRISRAPADGPRLEVPYTLTAFGSDGAASSRDGAATIAAGAAHTLVPITNGWPGGHEVITLALQDDPAYRVGVRSVTLIPGAAGNGCSDAALLQAYRQGQSAEAFAALVERYRTSVFRTCYRLLGNSQDAEDVTQMVFLVLAQRQVKLQTTLAGWLRTVAKNAAIVVLRSRSRRAHHEREAAAPDLEPSDEPTNEVHEELDLALTQVPPLLREAVRLRYLEGWSQNEAATIAGCPRGTLAQRAARGIRQLRAILLSRGNIVR